MSLPDSVKKGRLWQITYTVTAPAGKKISASVNFYNRNSYSHVVLCDVDATKSLSSVKKSISNEAINAYHSTTRIIVNCGINSDVIWEVRIESQ